MTADPHRRTATFLPTPQPAEAIASPSDQPIDDLIALVALLCETPTAVASVLDGRDHVFNRTTAAGNSELLPPDSLCAETARHDGVLVVPDAAADPRFANDPRVTGQPNVRFYAGTRLTSSAGVQLGLLCVMDTSPRQLTPIQLAAFSALSRQLVAHLELRDHVRALGRRERQLQAILDTEPECVKMLSRDGRLLFMNPAGLRMIQARTFDEVANRCIYGLVVDEHREAFQRLTERVFDGGGGTLLFEISGLEGDRRWLETCAAPLRDDAGAVDAVLAITRDVTDRRQAELEARESETRFATVFYTSPTAMMLATVDGGQIVDVNARFEAICGHPRSSCVGKTVSEVGVLSHDQLDVYLRHLRNGSITDAELQFHHASGELRTALVSAEVITIQGQPHVLTTLIDVTGWRRAEESLRNSEERLREVIDNIEEVVWETDAAKTEVLFVSPAYERIWGRTRQSLLDSPQDWLEAVDPEDRQRVAAAAAANQVLGTYDETYRIRRPDGAVRWIRDRAFPLRDESGRVTRIVGTAYDITEQRQLEEQLRQAQKMESVGRLAGGIAHDFNNLLTVINGTADLMLDRLHDDDPLHRDALQIRRAGSRAAAMTGQLLALSRRQILRPQVISLRAVVDEMKSMLRRLVGEHINLVTTYAADVGMVRVDPSQIEQVILNLAVNARDAMPNGGVLTFELANVHLDADYVMAHPVGRPGPHVMLAVTDTGVGMDEQTCARVFEPFFTTKEATKGTGLGLSTVYGIVKQSEGTIGVVSAPGRGTTFYVYLPQVDDAVSPPVAKLRTPSSGDETILLVEDEQPLRELATRVLSCAGYTVLAAMNGAEALAMAATHGGAIHLLLTDVVMPGINGRELAAAVERTRQGIKVLYMSGYTDDAILRHGVLDDQTRFISKPFSPDDLRSRVRETLDDTR